VAAAAGGVDIPARLRGGRSSGSGGGNAGPGWPVSTCQWCSLVGTVAHPDEVCQRVVMFRLLGLLGGLSLVTDLGSGAPLEESLKRSVVATRLARVAHCEPAEVSDVLYTSLLQHLGCTAYAHEGAEVWGEDVAFIHLAFLADFTDRKDMWRTWLPGLAEATGRSRARVLATAVTTGRKAEREGPRATCEVARDASRWLGLPPSVQVNLYHALAMWDGKGHPAVNGTAIPIATRVMHVASTAVLFALHADPDEAVSQVRRRSGTYLDPSLAGLFVSRAEELIGDLDDIDAYDAALACEPDPVRLVDDAHVEAVARAFGSLADLKSPWFQGHSSAVGDLAAAAVRGLGLADQVSKVRIAGYLHDLGRVGVSSRIWDKRSPLSASERDQVRLHPYHSERVVARVPALGQVAEIVGQHHERCDGSGYHRGLPAERLTMPSRVLAAADEYRDLVEERPHRPALAPADAARRLRDEARASRLDADAVSAVLAAAGQGSRVRRTRPAGLTDRQVEVLRLVAEGLSNQEIAKRLVISRRTAEHHVQDVYLKIGVSTRAGAALFAMEHGLLEKAG
jgi:HD-GYP domain-containing protein (c-di-GMP phosphodiesterase class II)